MWIACGIFCMSLHGSGVVGQCGGATWHRDGCKLEEHLLGGRLKLQFVLLGLLHVLLLGLLRPRSVVVG